MFSEVLNTIKLYHKTFLLREVKSNYDKYFYCFFLSTNKELIAHGMWRKCCLIHSTLN